MNSQEVVAHEEVETTRMSHTWSKQRTLPKMQSGRADSGSRAGAILLQLWPTLSSQRAEVATETTTTTTLGDSRITIIKEDRKARGTLRSKMAAAVLRNWRSKQSSGLPTRHLEAMTMMTIAKRLGLESSILRETQELKTKDLVAVGGKYIPTLILDLLRDTKPRTQCTSFETRTPTTSLLSD